MILLTGRRAATLLLAAVLGCAGEGPPPGPIVHPRAGSQLLGVNAMESQSSFARRRYDPKSDAERLHVAVPKIAVSYHGGSANGSGVAFCQVGRRLFVLTARHVATGRRRSGEDRYRMVRYGLSFYRGEIPELTGAERDFDVREIGDIDLALLFVELPNDGYKVPPLRIGRASSLGAGAPVQTLGYSMDELADWVSIQGRVRSAGDYLDYDPPLSQGFSGGPVFDQEGRLVGLNVEVQGSSFSRALPMEQVVPAVRALVDPACPSLP